MMNLPSRLQKNDGIGRFVSSVSGMAALKGSVARLTQMLRVSLYGLIKAINCPSGESCAPDISGFPNSNSRSIKGAFCAYPMVANKLNKINETELCIVCFIVVFSFQYSVFSI